MNTLTTKAITAHLFVVAVLTDRIERLRRDDRGQGSTEYAGILFVVVVIIGALIGLVETGVAEAIKEKIVEAVEDIGA
jgi:Flp pilus assembly pilin Flp